MDKIAIFAVIARFSDRCFFSIFALVLRNRSFQSVMRYRKGLIFAVAAIPVVFVLVFIASRMVTRPAVETVVGETAKSGLLRVGVEHALVSVTGDIATVFSRYYPDASIELEPGSFESLFNGFLQGDLLAMLVSGEPGRYEVSLLESKGIAYRLEPVARDAVVCIVNAANPVESLCVEELGKIYTAQKTRWHEDAAEAGEIKAYLNNNDIRLQQRLLALAVPEENRLTAWHTESDRELVRAVSREKGAVGVLSFSRVTALMASDPVSSSFRVVPLCKKNGDVPVMPSQYNVYQGEYPLGYIVYYMYRKGRALAAGFGAWLADEGQKGFTESGLAPYKQPVRVINLN